MGGSPKATPGLLMAGGGSPAPWGAVVWTPFIPPNPPHNLFFSPQETKEGTPTSANGSPRSLGITLRNMEDPTVATTGTTMMKATAPPHPITKAEGWAPQLGGTGEDPAAMAPSMGTHHPPHHPRSMVPTLTAPSSWSMAWTSPR